MIFLVDAYNVLFCIESTLKDLRSQREEIIEYFSDKFNRLGVRGTLIFDGSHRHDEESGKAYYNSLEIVFTHRGQSADAYIVQHIEHAKNPKEITVVTNDNGIKRHAKSLRANVKSCKSFIQFLEKKGSRPIEEKELLTESPKHFERLLKAFEESFHSK